MALKTVSKIRRKAYPYFKLAEETGRWDIIEAVAKGKLTPHQALKKLKQAKQKPKKRRKH